MNAKSKGNELTANVEGKRECPEVTQKMRCYQIRFRGHLDDHWAAWFQGCSLTPEADGTTTMVAPVIDQAELFGLLNRLRDLSLSLVSVSEVDPLEAADC